MKKIAKKYYSLSSLLSKIINSFPYAVAQTKSMNHDIWKYESQHGNPIQVSVS